MYRNIHYRNVKIFRLNYVMSTTVCSNCLALPYHEFCGSHPHTSILSKVGYLLMHEPEKQIDGPRCNGIQFSSVRLVRKILKTVEVEKRRKKPTEHLANDVSF
jgi:hypothetical protein